MLKTLFIALLLCIGAAAQAQDAPTWQKEDGLYTLTAVVPVTGATKQALYDRARRWAALNYVSSKAVLELADAESGTVIGKGILPYVRQSDVGKFENVAYTFVIDVKDGKYRLKATSFEINGESIAASTAVESVAVDRVKARYLASIEQNIRSTEASLRKAMNTDPRAGF
ncbi:DUF4468 domain-containing protein [Hymenobacter sp. BT18]|uniref:DUF4468 domain-containing protein n=1 Tax=Hymenobacter sp. BT18 TaxID=2835648 RepID=UPI00143E859B|nr:DUF4468 domain-containing protein [Hymenobacter sp. BT18]QIX60868.1 DUF4468 domain-containing protein [Hymenobacter sp. BT18]